MYVVKGVVLILYLYVYSNTLRKHVLRKHTLRKRILAHNTLCKHVLRKHILRKHTLRKHTLRKLAHNRRRRRLLTRHKHSMMGYITCWAIGQGGTRSSRGSRLFAPLMVSMLISSLRGRWLHQWTLSPFLILLL